MVEESMAKREDGRGMGRETEMSKKMPNTYEILRTTGELDWHSDSGTGWAIGIQKTLILN